MENAYAAADMVISRSGAMAIAELCVVKKPAVFVPFPFAAEDHQTVNAQNLVNKNAGIMIKDSDALDRLVPAIISLSRDVEKQNELKNNISKLGIINADEVIAKEILKLI
jgi:UDP-N-acetylglucosamine--N-acetylmuramyl-(pentapeptide) pyrophosphoryl-undecaprenol N-acetylglucosamine transferase